MMVEIDYRLSPPWDAGRATLDLASADESQLRYYAFPGDQILRIDGADFSALWGWVPLLDFAAALVAAVAQLAAGKDEAILFTENEARIVLRADGASVAVWCSYANGMAKIGRAELAGAAEIYAARLLDELASLFPALRDNRHLAGWYPGMTRR